MRSRAPEGLSFMGEVLSICRTGQLRPVLHTLGWPAGTSQDPQSKERNRGRSERFLAACTRNVGESLHAQTTIRVRA
jgi:hypothetical protein